MMARQVNATARPASSSSVTTLLTVDDSAQPPQETLVLQLRPRKKKVTWKEGTVDNEFMNKKSSKICCIFHKDKPFDEDDSDDDDHSHSGCPHHRSDGPDHEGCCRPSTSGTQ